MTRNINGDAPAKSATLYNAPKERDSWGIDNDFDSDGFWRYGGYGNDPKRRRTLRRKERDELRGQVRSATVEYIEMQEDGLL